MKHLTTLVLVILLAMTALKYTSPLLARQAGVHLNWDGSVLGEKEDLPVAVSLNYYLDGNPVSGGQIDDKCGRVDVEMHFSNQLTARLPQLGEVAWVPLAVQVSVELETDRYMLLDFGDATLTLNGDRVKLTWLVFPGPEAKIDLALGARGAQPLPLEFMVIPWTQPLGAETDSALAQQAMAAMPGVDTELLFSDLTALAQGYDSILSERQRKLFISGAIH
ncbi:MAG: hypothetical protein FH749_15220 [Firmicutes bacterium]|nr:hypothetical protein [Bacillota bacterium]